MRKNQTKAIIFALLSVLCWSTVAPAFKLALKEISVIQLLTISAGVATIVLFFINLFTGKIKQLVKINGRDILWSLLFGFINPVVYYIVLFTAYDRLPAQMAQPLNYTWPVMLSILAIPFLKQKLPLKALMALLISFAGVVVISVQNKDISGLESDALGIFLALISSVAWAIYWLLQFKSRLDKSLQLFVNFTFSFIFMLIIFFIAGESIPIGKDAWIPSVWTGIFEMGLTFMLWMKAMEYAEKTHVVSNLAFLSPFVSLFFINLVLKETITLYTVIGLSLIIIGILLQRQLSRKYGKAN